MKISRTYCVGLLFFTLSWLVYDHYRPWVNFHSEFLAFVGLLVLLASVLIQQRGPFILPPISLFLTATALLPWLQYAVGVNFFAGDALLSSLYLSGLLAAVLVGGAFARTDAGSLAYGLTGLMHGLWIAAMASAAIGLFQWLNLQELLGLYVVQTDFGDPVLSNLGQPNQFATLLLIGMVAYSYIFERRIIGPFVFALGIFFMTIVLVMTHSRAGMLGALVTSSFFLIKRIHMNSRLSSKSIVVWVLLFALANVVSPYLDQALFLNAEREPLFTSNGRTQLWLQILAGIAKSPWLGYGWNQTQTAHMVGALAYPGTVTFSYAHNILLDIIAWNGVPLGLLFVGLGGYWFCTRLYRVSGLNASYAMACLLPFTVHSLVEYPFAYAYFLITAGLMIGVVEASLGLQNGRRIKKSWVGSLMAVWAVVGSYMVYEYLLIEEDFRVVRFENLRIGATQDSYQVPDVWMISHLATMLKVSRQPSVPTMTALQLSDLHQVSSRFPNGSLNLRYALALGLNGDPDGATLIMSTIRNLFGEKYYDDAKLIWRENVEKYPQLKTVTLP